MEKNKNLFYGEKNLKGYSYKIMMKDSNNCAYIRDLSRRINALGGQVTFSSSNTIITIIESRELLKSEQFDIDLKNFNKAVFFVLGTTVVIKEDKKQQNIGKSLRVIHLKDFEDQLDTLESLSIDIHYKHGLPKSTDKDGTISLVNIPDKKVKFHTFQKLPVNKQNPLVNSIKALEYNIPFYHPNVPNGFSIFMNQEEKVNIESYLSKNGIPRNMIEADDVNAVPIPRKEHFFCHICQCRYEDYLEHLKSTLHQRCLEKQADAYSKIEGNFKRIREFWEEHNKKKNQNVSEILFLNNSNQEFSTKFDTNLSNQAICVNQAEVKPNSALKKTINEEEIENKENMSILNNNNINQCVNNENINTQNFKINSNILNVKNPDVNKMSTQKRKFSEINFKESFEIDITKRSVRMMNRNIFFKNNKNFNKVSENLEYMKNLMKKSISFNFK